MNKILKLVFAILTISAIFFGCAQESIPDDSQNPEVIIDLRNKTDKGISYRSPGNGPYTFNYILDRSNVEYNKKTGSDVPEWAIKTISVEDCEEGVKFIFHRPDPKDCPLSYITWFNIYYIDENGNQLINISPKDAVRNINDSDENGTIIAKETFEVLFPLVLPGRKVSLWVEYSYDDKENTRDIFLPFIINTAHGKAMPDDFPKYFDCSSYVDIKQGKYLFVHNIIPPQGKNLRRIIRMVEYTDDGKVNQFFCDNFPISDGIEKNTKIDLTELTLPGKSYPRVSVEFTYGYDLDEFPELIFASKSFMTEIKTGTVFSLSKQEYLEAGYYKEIKKISDTEYKASVKSFGDLLKFLNEYPTAEHYKLTVTDKKPDLTSFFQRICWDDVKFAYTYSLDLTETEVTEIPKWQLYDAKPISEVLLPETLVVIGDGAFEKTSITNLTVPAGVKWMGQAVIPYEKVSEGEFSYKGTITFADSTNWYRTWIKEKWNNRDSSTSSDCKPYTEGSLFEVWDSYFKAETSE